MSVDAIVRLERIRAEVGEQGRVRVVELARALDVSEMTVRRDLDLLDRQGHVRRVRGGATSIGPRPFGERYDQHGRAKQRIAEKLAPLLDGGGAIGIDASTTLQRLADLMGEVTDLTVLTNGPDTFAALQDLPGVTALITGGRLDARTGSLVGPLTGRSVGDFGLRRLFISAAGVDPEFGNSETTIEDAEAKRDFVEVSDEVILAVDSSKLGSRGSARCLGLDRISVLVTELDPRDVRLDPYRDRVAALL